MTKRWRLLAAAVALFGLSPGAGSAQCVGSCGTLGADGVVIAPPGFTTYGWVSSAGGVRPAGLPAVGGATTNGSYFRSALFTANANDVLQFYFNYVSSDGDVYTDYAWARLLRPDLSEAAIIFTARTTPAPGGSTIPGFGMPPLDPNTTVTPSPVTIVPGTVPNGGPAWSPLGGSSTLCYDVGCGYTGWVLSEYAVGATGSYFLELGVANWIDELWDSGLAYQGVQIAGTPVPSTPGETEDLPQLPNYVIDESQFDDIPPVFVFENVLSDLWFDPMLADAYDFVSTGPSLFTEAKMPTGFGAPFAVYTGPTFSDFFGSFLGGQEADFTAFAAGGIDRFRIAGIAPPTDATDPTAFPVQLAFTQAAGNSFTMTPVPLATSAPEPAAVALLGTGLVALLGAAGRRRRHA